MVQHHVARAEHYDFRLEIGGTLRSWAVPKGPSPSLRDKRFAVQTEDHPLEYAAFEGRIPEGNYGAGSVIVWDRGAWVPDGEPESELAAGKLAFELRGYKLRGKWALIKTRKGPKDWLLIKERDAYVSDGGTAGYPADSILSGLTVHELAAGADPAAPIAERLAELGAPRRRVRGAAVKPMLAQSAEPFSRSGWLFEIKYDGYRLIAERDGVDGRLYSRAGNDLTATFPEVADAVRALPFTHLVLDGEVVVHDERGLPSFARLQQRAKLVRPADVRRAAVQLPAALYAFDLVGFDGWDPRPLPLIERKALLQRLLPSVGPVRYAEHIADRGEAMYEQARELGLEGVVAKQADSRYVGRRSAHWRKIVIARSDDFAVLGYTDPKGSQAGFGALLLGQYDAGDEPVYVGRVGSGFDRATLEALAAHLHAAPSAAPPAAAPRQAGWHWVEPSLVVEVRYKNLSRDGVLRQPVFLRLRADKGVTDCVLHEPAPEPPPPAAATAAANEAEAPRTVRLTNRDKVFWPEDGYTKGDLLDYHRMIAPWLLPWLADRPVVLTRFPDGIDGKSFFQKDAPAFAPDWIRRETIWSEHAEREVHYFVADDLETLLYIVNLGNIPLHVWSSRVAALERPDWSILDLDPKGAPFADVLRIARSIHELCGEIGLPDFIKTSGSTGLHILIPLGGRCTYEQSRTLAELIARIVARELPDVATVVRNPRRREGKVYIDYLQNGHGRLLVAPFSVRPLPGAPVSMPLRWHEVTRSLQPRRYHIRNAVRRMRALGECPMRGVLELRPDLVTALDILAARFAAPP